MRLPFIRIPDFKKQVEEEDKPEIFYKDFSDAEKRDYIRNRITQSMVMWSCKTSLAAYNLCWIVIIFLILTMGNQILQLIQQVVKSKVGL